MKYCSNCGNPTNDDNQKFCLKCGTALQTTDKNMSFNNTQTSYNSGATAPQHPMKWFKFLIYFALFFGAFLELCFAINYISGDIYFVQTNGQVTADMVYGIYGATLKIVDVLYGILVICAAVFSIVTRFKLSKYKKEGPMFLYILYIAGAVMGLIYNIAVAAITRASGIFNMSFIMTLIITAIITWANYKYFEKRKDLFVR